MRAQSTIPESNPTAGEYHLSLERYPECPQTIGLTLDKTLSGPPPELTIPFGLPERLRPSSVMFTSSSLEGYPGDLSRVPHTLVPLRYRAHALLIPPQSTKGGAAARIILPSEEQLDTNLIQSILNGADPQSWARNQVESWHLPTINAKDKQIEYFGYVKTATTNLLSLDRSNSPFSDDEIEQITEEVNESRETVNSEFIALVLAKAWLSSKPLSEDYACWSSVTLPRKSLYRVQNPHATPASLGERQPPGEIVADWEDRRRSAGLPADVESLFDGNKASVFSQTPLCKVDGVSMTLSGLGAVFIGSADLVIRVDMVLGNDIESPLEADLPSR